MLAGMCVGWNPWGEMDGGDSERRAGLPESAATPFLRTMGGDRLRLRLRIVSLSGDERSLCNALEAGVR
jgi:hypothetical protein